jgi:hypothetical protein
VHRDVRWCNLILVETPPLPKRWVLIDLELSGKQDEPCDQDPFPLLFWKMPDGGNVLEDGRYTHRSDLRMLAVQLLSGLPCTLSPQVLGTVGGHEASWVTTCDDS